MSSRAPLLLLLLLLLFVGCVADAATCGSGGTYTIAQVVALPGYAGCTVLDGSIFEVRRVPCCAASRKQEWDRFAIFAVRCVRVQFANSTLTKVDALSGLTSVSGFLTLVCGERGIAARGEMWWCLRRADRRCVVRNRTVC